MAKQSVLSEPQFHDEAAAFAWLEGVIWPEGPVCPHCGGRGRISKIKPNAEKRVRMGLHKCGDCSKQFTVKVGTVFEHARIPLNMMLQAVHLLTSSKNGISAHRLHRILGVQYKTAWFLAHRIREAMRGGSLAPMGGQGGVVEADETSIGREPGKPKKRAYRYLAEFDFRYGNRVALGVGDVVRSEKALTGIVGKRLFYADSPCA